MKPREAFGVVVRTIGLLLSLWALALVFIGLVNVAIGTWTDVFVLCVCGILIFLVGLFLIDRADDVAALAYLRSEQETSAKAPHRADAIPDEQPRGPSPEH